MRSLLLAGRVPSTSVGSSLGIEAPASVES
jgi:hypothetical protein